MKYYGLAALVILSIYMREIECRWIPACQVVVKKSVLLTFSEYPQPEETEVDVCTCPTETIEKQDTLEAILENDLNSTKEDVSKSDDDDDSCDEESALKLKFDLEKLLRQSDDSENEIKDASENEIIPNINKTKFKFNENFGQNVFRTNNFQNDLTVLQFPVELMLSGDMSIQNVDFR